MFSRQLAFVKTRQHENNHTFEPEGRHGQDHARRAFGRRRREGGEVRRDPRPRPAGQLGRLEG